MTGSCLMQCFWVIEGACDSRELNFNPSFLGNRGAKEGNLSECLFLLKETFGSLCPCSNFLHEAKLCLEVLGTASPLDCGMNFSAKVGSSRKMGKLSLSVFHGVMLPSSSIVPMHFGIIFETAI